MLVDRVWAHRCCDNPVPRVLASGRGVKREVRTLAVPLMIFCGTLPGGKKRLYPSHCETTTVIGIA